MAWKKLIGLVSERLKTFLIMIREGNRFGDKIIILEYHLRAPIQALNYLRGVKNSRIMSGEVFIKNKYGLFFCGKNFSSVFGAISNCEPEVRREFVLDKGVALDVGANLGMFSIPLAKKLGSKGKVISIEAERNNVNLLKKNVELNGLKNVIVIGKGAYSKKGKINLNIDEFGTGGHSIQKTNVSEFGKKEIIEVDTIDNIIKDLKIKKVDIIKIDIEGGEPDAFKGASKTLKRDHPKIIFEAIENKDRVGVEKILKSHRYKIRKIGEWNYVAE